MSNPNKAKGTRAMTAVSQFLVRSGFYMAENRALRGSRDLGDHAGIEHVVIETKDEKSHSISTYLKEAQVERDNAGARVGFAWFKKRGTTDPGEWYVLMDGYTIVQLLREAGYGPYREPEGHEAA